MPKNDAMKGFNDIIILKLLLHNDSYGYEISKKITAYTKKEYKINEQTLYSALNRLEKKEYVTSYQKDENCGKKRTYYQISESGKKYFKQKYKEFKKAEKIIHTFMKECN